MYCQNALLRRVLFKRRKIFVVSRNARGNSSIFTRSILRAHFAIHRKTYNVGGRRCINKKMITIHTDTTYVLGTRVSVYHNKHSSTKKTNVETFLKLLHKKKNEYPSSSILIDSRARGSSPCFSSSILDSSFNARYLIR